MAIEGIKSAAASAAVAASANNVSKQNTTVTETKEVSVQSNKQPEVSKAPIANKSGQQTKDDAGTDGFKSVEQDIQINEKALKQRISEINSKLNNNTVAEFGYHDATNRVTIKIVDKETKETIKEIPPEKTLDLIAKAWELAGILVDEKR